ncbi:hypothetical protein LOZ58_006353 [Ophidiomyces ophidiicola]|nr:hypothetical protein LOZ58_006353 [Ophidiomyces ophidiicola]
MRSFAAYVRGDSRPGEAALLRKLDFFILSFCCLMYFANYLDRSNLANAYVSGMKEDLAFHGRQFNLINTIFTVGYILGQVPSNLALTYVPPRLFFPAMMLLWGGLTMVTAAVQSPQAIMAIRFFLGLAESSTFVGTHYILGSWYTERELGKRSGIFTASGLAGTMFGGFIQTGINSSLHGARGLPGWRWLFIVGRRADHGADRAVRVLPVPGHAAHDDGAIPQRRGAGAGDRAGAGGAGGAAPAGLGVRAAGVWRVALVRVRDAVGDRGRDGVVLDQRAAGAVHEGAPDAAVHGGAAEQLPDGRGGGGHRVDAVLGDADGLPGRAAVPGGLLDRGDGGGDVGDDPGAAGVDDDGVRGVLLGRVGVRVPGDVLRVGQRRDAVPRRRAAQRGDRQHEHGQQRGERVVEHPVLRGRHGAVLHGGWSFLQ